MPPFFSTSRVVESLISRRGSIRNVINSARCNVESSKYRNVRNSRCIPGAATSSIRKVFDHDHKVFSGGFRDSNAVQTRRFLGCGDGEEGSVLSKVYEERRIFGYSPEQLYDVVAAVDLYHDFVPWCQRSEVLKNYPDGSFDAELEIGFKFLVESYISHVEICKPKSVKSTVSQSSLFDHLINIWEFSPGSVPGTCNLHFFVDFKFQSPLHRQLASMFFKEVVSRLVGSFNERCRVIYGPGVPVLENSYSQRA